MLGTGDETGLASFSLSLELWVDASTKASTACEVGESSVRGVFSGTGGSAVAAVGVSSIFLAITAAAGCPWREVGLEADLGDDISLDI